MTLVAAHLRQDHKARLPLSQRGDMVVIRADDQIAPHVPARRNLRSWAGLTDRGRILDLTQLQPFPRPVPQALHCAAAAQAILRFFLLNPKVLDVGALVDRLVADAAHLFFGMLGLGPPAIC